MKKILIPMIALTAFSGLAWSGSPFENGNFIGYSLYEEIARISEESIHLGNRLCDAALKGNLEKVRYLVARGASVNFIKSEIASPRTPLNAAIIGGHLKVVKYLVSQGAHINKVLEGDSPPLVLAVKSGNNSIIHFLLQHGADPDISGKEKISINNFENNDQSFTLAKD